MHRTVAWTRAWGLFIAQRVVVARPLTIPELAPAYPFSVVLDVDDEQNILWADRHVLLHVGSVLCEGGRRDASLVRECGRLATK